MPFPIPLNFVSHKAIRFGWTMTFSLFLLSSCATDILIKNASILDGSGAEAYVGDVAVRKDRITAIGSKVPKKAKLIIDATGYTLCPGFVDPHTHAEADLRDSIRNSNQNYLFQGVTTVMVGSDGGGPLDVGQTFAHWEQHGIGTNAAILAGHRTIRRRIMGMRDAAPTVEEMDQMKGLVEQAMRDGALGFSSGLYYAPASFSNTEEVIELAGVAARYGGIYDVHLRDESSYNIGLLAAIEETIEIGRANQMPVNIAHIKCLGVDVWGLSDTIVQIVEAAQSAGIAVTADQYPYQASGTHLAAALVPKWVFADGDLHDKLQDTILLDTIKAGIRENLRKRGGPEAILLTIAKNPDWSGKNLAEVAKLLELSAVEATIAVLLGGGAAIASFNMQDSDIHTFMRQPWVMTSSDGSSGHPRKYGSYPRKIRKYILEENVLSLAEMVRKSTSLPAETFGIRQRGRIQEGYFADLILFKPAALQDQSTFVEPALLATGMQWVIVNGKVAVREGVYTGILAGRGIKKFNK